MGFSPEESDPLKLVFRASRFGYTGDALADLLRRRGIEPEFSDRDFLVLMLTPENCEEGCARLIASFSDIERRAPIESLPLSVIPDHKAQLSVRDAVFSDFEILPIERSLGRIAASPTIACPPAVPIVISGEVIGEDDIELFSYYGISEISVIQ
jgi:arginine/lysine/ornithine decarboxylase